MSAADVTVLITRPLAQAQPWAQHLASLDFATHCVPVMAITAVTDSAQRQKIHSLISHFDQFSKVIFVSQNAIAETVRWLDQYWPQFPVGIQYFAVGASTARAATAAGLVVQAADQAMNSETLLALPDLQQVSGEKIVICRGVGGRSMLSETLTQRGAQVSYCELYHRTLPDDASAQLQQLLTDPKPHQWLFTAHSGESLANLAKVLKCVQHQGLLATPILVPGERVAALATSLGFRQVITAINATDDAMTQALLDWRGNHVK